MNKMSKNEHTDQSELHYQKLFVDWLTSLDATPAAESGLAYLVKTKYLHRLDTYQASYLGRVTGNLSDTLFEACENLFGPELVAQILAGFFKASPPQADLITDAANGLPAMLRQTQTAAEALLFADLAEICIARWRILTSADSVHAPIPEGHPLNQVQLSKNVHLIWPCARHDLSETWTLAQRKIDSGLPAGIFSQEVGVLLAKSSSVSFHVVAVPERLRTLVQSLVNGADVESAVLDLERHLEGNSSSKNRHSIPDQLQELLSSCISKYLQKQWYR